MATSISRRQFTKLSLTGSAVLVAGSAMGLGTFAPGSKNFIRLGGPVWGEHSVNLAWSENLCDWHPLLNEDGTLEALISPRDSKFDSELTECGPPAILREDGVLLIYNGKNSTNHKADTSLPKGTYSMGQVLFDANDLHTVLQRTDTCLLKPTLPHEIIGQYKAGTVFSEGLVFFKNKWHLYYGTADSYVGLAVSDNLIGKNK